MDPLLPCPCSAFLAEYVDAACPALPMHDTPVHAPRRAGLFRASNALSCCLKSLLSCRAPIFLALTSKSPAAAGRASHGASAWREGARGIHTPGATPRLDPALLCTSFPGALCSTAKDARWFPLLPSWETSPLKTHQPSRGAVCCKGVQLFSLQNED